MTNSILEEKAINCLFSHQSPHQRVYPFFNFTDRKLSYTNIIRLFLLSFCVTSFSFYTITTFIFLESFFPPSERGASLLCMFDR